MLRRMILLTCSIAIFLITAGCWDRVEIDERGFVVGVAVDTPPMEESEEEEREEEPGKPHGPQHFMVTYQIVNPAGLGGGTGARTGGEQKAFFNTSSIEETMFSANSVIAAKTSRPPFFEHLMVIVVSEDVARSKQGFGNVLDYFLRDNEMRRTVKVMVASGQARKVLEVEPPIEKLPMMYVDSAAENTNRSARMVPESRIGDVHEYLLKDESFVIQRIRPYRKEAIIVGAAVFGGKDKRMIGFLNGEETEGLNFLRGTIRGGALEFAVGDNLATFDIERVRRKIKLDYGDEEDLKVTVSVETEGTLGETFKQVDLLKTSTIPSLERQLEKEIERLAKDCIEKLQKDYRQDAIGIDAFLYQNHYKLWKKIKNDWNDGDRLFSKCNINVKAKAKIRRIGTINNSEKRF